MALSIKLRAPLVVVCLS